MMALSPESQPRSFDAPQEPERHRKIAEAAYYLAAKRGFLVEHFHSMDTGRLQEDR
jgi:Protein of unknown function (DUF2934)